MPDKLGVFSQADAVRIINHVRKSENRHQSNRARHRRRVRSSDSSAATVFPVDLEKFSGSDGTDTAATTWKYNVRAFGETAILLSDVNPTAAPHKYRRHNLGSVTFADFGLAFYDTEGTLILTWINEKLNLSKCGEPATPSSPSTPSQG